MLNHLGQYWLLREKHDTVLLIKFGVYFEEKKIDREIGNKTQLYQYHSCSFFIQLVI